MGRYVSLAEGDFDWRWKFWFAEQCSNFGFILQMAKGDDVRVLRYTGEDGEYVRLYAEKEKLLETLNKLEINECPVCKSQECLEATREMLKDFREAVAKHEDDEICATWFAEY